MILLLFFIELLFLNFIKWKPPTSAMHQEMNSVTLEEIHQAPNQEQHRREEALPPTAGVITFNGSKEKEKEKICSKGEQVSEPLALTITYYILLYS